MSKIRISIREINSALSIINLESGNEDIKESLGKAISFMLENKKQYLEEDENAPVCKFIKELSILHKEVLKTQRRG